MEKFVLQDHLYVLIAEDDHAERNLLFEAFKESDLEKNIEFVTSGQDLLDFLINPSQTRQSLPAIIIMDLNMPGISGIETIERIKNNNGFKMIPILVLSNSDHEKDIVKAYMAGANSYIQKPQTYKDLLELISEIYCFWLKRVQYPPLKA